MGTAEQLWSPDVFWLYGRLPSAGGGDCCGQVPGPLGKEQAD